MKIIKSEDSLDRFNEAGLAEVLKSSLRKYKYLLYIYILISALAGLRRSSQCVLGFTSISFQ